MKNYITPRNTYDPYTHTHTHTSKPLAVRRTSSPRTHTHVRTHLPAFTIIELLIVIVVIAILAALSIVTYTGIQNRARETAVQADLSNMARQLGIESAQAEGSYPSACHHSQALILPLASSTPPTMVIPPSV